MEVQFKKFTDNIRLTEKQEADAKKKYNGVCAKLHKSYYNSEYDGKTKYLFGSYKTKTNSRPLSKNQDVDVLFKIPEETYKKFKDYNGNGPSALLQEIRGVLKDSYTTTDAIKGWGKIVLVMFSNNSHNVEVLPAFELEDNTFMIPNSEAGGKWEVFHPRKQIATFQSSNSRTNSLTADLTRMMKTWVKCTSSLDYKSYTLLNDVIDFLKSKHKKGAKYSDYHLVIMDYFEYLKDKSDSNFDSHIKTAFNRAKKAVDLIKEDKPKDASLEWRKIFGDEYPMLSKNPVKSEPRVFSTPSSPYADY